LVLARSGTSITMDRDVLKWIDEKVKERVFASRSHAFEYAVRHLMKKWRRRERDHDQL
jgi:Arc/MetJ-type ribon-helix-helix transcriptional regulator